MSAYFSIVQWSPGHTSHLTPHLTQALVLHSLAEGGGVAELAGAELGIHPDRVKPWPHRMFVNVRILPCIGRCLAKDNRIGHENLTLIFSFNYV